MRHKSFSIVILCLVLFLLFSGFFNGGVESFASDSNCVIKEVAVAQHELCDGSNINCVGVTIDLDTNLINYVELYDYAGEVCRFYPQDIDFSGSNKFDLYNVPSRFIDDIYILVTDLNNQEYEFPSKSNIFENVQLRTSGIYDGEWSGKTNQNYDVSFTISNNMATSLSIKYKVYGSLCIVTTTTTVSSRPGESIVNNSFTYSSKRRK